MALRAGSVGLGREAGLGARRGWTRRRRPPHARGRPRGALPPRHPAPLPPAPPPALLPPPRLPLSAGGGVGGRRDRGGSRGRERPGPRWRGEVFPPRGPGHPGGRRRRRLWTRAGPFPWIAPAAAGVAAAPGEPGGRRRAPAARVGGGAGAVRGVCRPSAAAAPGRVPEGALPLLAPPRPPAGGRAGPRRAPAVPPPSRPAAAGASVPPAGCAPGAAVPRGASPRPAPSSRLRTGADQGNPTV